MLWPSRTDAYDSCHLHRTVGLSIDSTQLGVVVNSLLLGWSELYNDGKGIFNREKKQRIGNLRSSYRLFCRLSDMCWNDILLAHQHGDHCHHNCNYSISYNIRTATSKYFHGNIYS